MTPGHDKLAAPETRWTSARAILALAIPILVSVVLDAVSNMINTATIGRSLGAEGLAAVGVAMAVFQVVSQATFAGLSGFSILAARHVGAEDNDGLRRVFHAGARIALGLLVIAAVLLVLGAPVLTSLFGVEQEYADDASALLRLLAAALAFSLAFTLLNSYLIAHRVSKPGMIASLAGNIANVITTFALVSQLGVVAFAVGVTVGELLSLLLIFPAIFRRSELSGVLGSRPGKHLREQLRLSIPEVINNGLDYLGNFTFVLIVSIGGSAALAANRVAFNIYIIIFMAGMSLAIAVQVFVGQSLGGKDVRRAQQYFTTGLMIGVPSFACLGIVIASGSDWIAELLVPGEAEVQQTISQVLRLMVIAAPLLAAASVTLNRLKAAGRTATAARINVLSTWAVQVLGAWVLVQIFGFDLVLCFVALIAYLAVRTVWAVAAWKAPADVRD